MSDKTERLLFEAAFAHWREHGGSKEEVYAGALKTLLGQPPDAVLLKVADLLDSVERVAHLLAGEEVTERSGAAAGVAVWLRSLVKEGE